MLSKGEAVIDAPRSVGCLRAMHELRRSAPPARQVAEGDEGAELGATGQGCLGGAT